MTARKIKRLFIANRGEIARRIAGSARLLGIETAMITKHRKPPAFLVGVVDHFIQVPDETSATFLNADFMVRTAQAAGCDAVHPGFGFLSENAAFAKKVIDAGMIWVGPSPKAIEQMASKENARHIAEKAGLPCVPAVPRMNPNANAKELEEVLTAARKIGFPLIIKAALGGGGKGMRLVEKEADLLNAAKLASSEALSSFGDGSILIEKYLGAPRHVEVQVLGDQQGHVYAIGDRDCSVQRRHQKIIEEAPAPGLNPETRAAMHQAAASLAKAVGYFSAGTVEFLLDWSEATAKQKGRQNFYFLEMNTRLQVEHPVTEEVFGIDLVAWQLRIAMGEAMPESFATLTPRGHSVEARLYAEDVRNQFFPSPGIVHAFVPAQGLGIRWEIGLDAVDQITADFDPMVSKLVVHGENRMDALDRMAACLDETIFVGPETNMQLVSAICRDPVFRDQIVTTHYIGDRLQVLLDRLTKTQDAHEETLNKWLKGMPRQGLGASQNHVNQIPARTRAIFMQSAPTRPECDIIITQESMIRHREQEHLLTRVGRGLAMRSDGEFAPFIWADARHPEYRRTWISFAGAAVTSTQEYHANLTHGRAGATKGDVTAPVPGKVKRILVGPGDSVSKNQTVIVLESMKMEFEVQAPKAGVVDQVKIADGAQVNADDLLITWQE